VHPVSFIDGAGRFNELRTMSLRTNTYPELENHFKNEK
jgi:hypothetical protein